MRLIALGLVAAGLVSLSGCGCLEGNRMTLEDSPDPDQPSWQRCLFGTRYVESRFYGGKISPQYVPNATEQSD